MLTLLSQFLNCEITLKISIGDNLSVMMFYCTLAKIVWFFSWLNMYIRGLLSYNLYMLVLAKYFLR